jgi:phosphopantothenoylcysteine synthetase/decarboxylase
VTGGQPGRVLYLIVCGSPAARRVATLVELAQRDGWDVCVIASPDGRKFIDVPALAELTGHPVRSTFKNPGEPDVLPEAHAMIVAPATVNTINKWAAGIADTLPLGLIVEAIGKGLPIVAMPFTNEAMAAHPAFAESLRRLASWGVTLLWGDEVLERFAPRSGDALVDEFPWHLALAALPPMPPPVPPPPP